MTQFNGLPPNPQDPANNGPEGQPYAQPGQPYTPPPQQPYAQPGQPYTPPQQPYAQPGQPYTPPQQPYAQPGQPYTPQQQPYGDPNTRPSITEAAACHWLTLLGFIGTVIMYVIKKDTPAAREEAARAVNWTVPFAAATIVISIVSSTMLNSIPWSAYGTGAASATLAVVNLLGLLNFGLNVFMVIVGIMNAIKVGKGQPSSHPFLFTLFK